MNFIIDFIFSVSHLIVQLILVISISILLISIFYSKIIPIQYSLPLKISSLLCSGIFLIILGGQFKEIEWKEKYALLEYAQQNTSKQVEIKYIEKIKEVKGKTNVIIKEVPKYITKESDNRCILPKSAIVLHDSATNGEIPDTTRSIDESPSEVKLSDYSRTVIENYGSCLENSEQLIAIQNWIKEQQKLKLKCE